MRINKSLCLNFFVGISILSIVVSAYLFTNIKEKSYIESIKNENSDLREEISFFKNERSRYTVENIVEEIEKENIDLNKSKKDLEVNIHEGIKKIYKKSLTRGEYNVLKKELPNTLGEQFSRELVKKFDLVFSQPESNVAEGEELKDSKISFGEYKKESKSIAVAVFVKSIYGEGKTRVEVNTIFKLDYKIKENTLELKDFTQSIN